MKNNRILISADGPDVNVIKLKPPMVFTKQNVDSFISLFDEILGEAEKEMDVNSDSTTVLPEMCRKPNNMNQVSEELIKSI